MSLEQKARKRYRKPCVQVFFFVAQEIVCTSAGSNGDLGSLKPSDLGHTHCGSTGNLCNDRIAALMSEAFPI